MRSTLLADWPQPHIRAPDTAWAHHDTAILPFPLDTPPPFHHVPRRKNGRRAGAPRIVSVVTYRQTGAAPFVGPAHAWKLAGAQHRRLSAASKPFSRRDLCHPTETRR